MLQQYLLIVIQQRRASKGIMSETDRGRIRTVETLRPYTLLNYRYIVEQVLGAGGFGITYSVLDIQTGQKKVIKELYPAMTVERNMGNRKVEVTAGKEVYFQQLRQNFVNEARILKDLQGKEGIVPVYDLFNQNGTSYYVMEYLKGQTLRIAVDICGKMQWSELSPFIGDVVEALDVLHGKNLLHRDVSPDNIILGENKKGWLIDYGSVRTYLGNKNFTAFLKKAFAPLEQYYTNGRQGPWTDIYALSTTLYYVLGGQLPPDAVDRKVGKQVTLLSTLSSTLPSHVAKAIHKGMALEISERYQSMRDYKKALFPVKKAVIVRCLAGVFLGKTWKLMNGGILTVGRDTGCSVRYPEETRGVSRKQCIILYKDDGGCFLLDEGSRYGTFVSGRRIAVCSWMSISPGTIISFGREQYRIEEG